eukprot:CAMPEP_0202730194 /NCGR_PEP_ID=MMETSP1385-20130828/186517_1 /ASSEMBLY_ACC=CAM_ASM_000861 /TAXON_ID=933848 /ORGANISM="Elphidium margaritaceum" /LENGTH=374 /DNA_ID=CAMNT_0049396467 /DNA_START=455 /DNA_END=1580 /DNA_ORIENTATION=-
MAITFRVSAWTSQMVITICMLLIIWCKKVSDGIGCLRETLLSLSILFLISLLVPVLVVDKHVYAVIALHSVFIVAPYLQGIIPLFGGLFYLAEDGIGCLRETLLSLSILLLISLLVPLLNIHQHAYEALALNAVFIVAPYLQGIIPLFGGLYYLRRMNALNEKTSSDIEKPLHEFLLDYNNYAMLMQHLTHCWASETMLFLHKVCVLNHVLVQHQRDNTNLATLDSVPSESLAEDTPAAAANADLDTLIFDVQQFKFTYLEQVYAHYRRALRVSTNVTHLYREIYDEFVAVGSINEINVSWTVRSAVIAAFELQDEEATQTTDGCLHIFDEALEEVYDLIESVYRSGFKQHIRDHIERHEMRAVRETSACQISA